MKLTVSLSRGIRVAYSIFCALNWRIFKVSLVFDVVFWFDVIFLEFLPCLVLLFCFASMCRVVRKHDRVSRTTAKQLRFNHRVFYKIQGKSAIKLMAVVIGLFLLCYGFSLRCTLVFIFENGQCNDEEYKLPLLVLNSAINPVAYAFFNRDIKKEVKKNYVSLYCSKLKHSREKYFILSMKTTV